MKNLILCAIAFLFLFTSCFENTDEVTVVPVEEEIAVVPIEGNIMECELVTKFIEEMQSVPAPPRQDMPRAKIEKYLFRNDSIYIMHTPNSYWSDTPPQVIQNCNVVCTYSQIDEFSTCKDYWNGESPKFIKTIWQDNR